MSYQQGPLGHITKQGFYVQKLGCAGCFRVPVFSGNACAMGRNGSASNVVGGAK